MIKHEILNLELTNKQIKSLKAHNQKIFQHLEKGLPLKMAVLQALKDDLSGIVNKNPDWKRVLENIRDSGDYYCIHLLHPDNEILNLSWSMAVDDVSGQPLGSIRQLYFTKSIPRHFKKESKDFTKAAPPLKILIMVSLPEDPDDQVNQGWEKRISYEEEEFEILKAFEPLMQTGQVEIDFTEDGSLGALERKLMANKYHILHFSGHAIFSEKDNTGYLQLENPVSLRAHRVTARDFANTINCSPEYQVPMVVLSSCQTAKGSSEKGLRGVTNHLLRIRVPVVVSMGMSIKDHYAAQFSAHFYSQIARQQTIFSAFYQAVAHIRKNEYSDLVEAHVTPAVPLQWIIPNLYLSHRLDRIVDWDQPQEKLELSSNRYIFEKDLLLLKHEREYLFIGRRKEKAEILGPLFEKKPVLLKGQGGVGKTAMAEHLVQRLIAANSKTIPFVFNEKIRSIKEIMEILQNFLREQGYIHVISEINQYEKGMDKFLYLVFTIAQKCNFQPVFVFDNLETFQSEPGQPLSDEFSDIKTIIDFLCTSGKFHVILTCRYPVPDVKNLQSFDLNQVGLNDTWKKCLYIDVGHIHTYLLEAAAGKKTQGLPRQPIIPFIDIVKLLHQTFGGNYRALEFFNQLLRANPERIKNALDSLETFQRDSQEAVEEVKQKMGQSLLFSRLMALLEPKQQRILELLSHFRVPVLQHALQMQLEKQENREPVDLPTTLEHLHRLTLMEIALNRELQVVYYYVTPIVKDLLAGYKKEEEEYHFSHEKAGGYYYHYFYNIEESLTPLEEAFYHFDESGSKDKVEEIGDRLSRFYYGYSMFRNAYFYAQRVYELLGEETTPRVLNRLGLIYDLYGDYDHALTLFQKTLGGFQEIGDRSGEGTTLNNISQIYDSRGDYETALKYLEQSLKISQEIGDKAGEGTTLNNISQIFKARGDYETALKYLEQSLKISQEIGDKSGSIPTLHNMALIALEKKDIEKFMEYETTAYKIAMETQDAMGIYNVGRELGFELAQQGMKKEGIALLKRSLEIGKAAGFPDVGEIEKMLRELGKQ
ncbi:MAG: tetratricopeptide repeat protein [Candidatus Aminicenantes bacterium]|jgi:tetratricopeptide (TPR) repeat protein